jgi:hypothetical protein
MYEFSFRDAGERWLEHWIAIRRFVRVWHQVPVSETPLTDEQYAGQIARCSALSALEAHCLPQAWAAWEVFCDELDEKQAAGLIRDDRNLGLVPGQDALEFFRLYEGDACWATERDDLRHPNPPVSQYFLDHHAPEFRGDRFEKTIPSVTSFALDYLSFCLHAEGGGFSTKIDVKDNWLAELEAVFDVRASFEGMEIFEMNRIIVLVSENWFSPVPAIQLSCHLHDEDAMSLLPECVKRWAGNGGRFYGQMAGPPPW